MSSFYIVFVGEKEVLIQSLDGHEISIDKMINLLKNHVHKERQITIQEIVSFSYLPKGSGIMKAAKEMGIETLDDFLDLPRPKKKEFASKAGYKPSCFSDFLRCLGLRAHKIANPKK